MDLYYKDLDALRALIELGFLRHGQEGLNKAMKMRGEQQCVFAVPLWGIIQCLLHPVIP